MNDMIINCVSMEYVMLQGFITFIGVFVSGFLFFLYKKSDNEPLLAIAGAIIAIAIICWSTIWINEVNISSPEVKEEIWKEAVNANKAPDIEITSVVDYFKDSKYEVTLANGETYCIPYETVGLKKRKIFIKYIKPKKNASHGNI